MEVERERAGKDKSQRALKMMIFCNKETFCKQKREGWISPPLGIPLFKYQTGTTQKPQQITRMKLSIAKRNRVGLNFGIRGKVQRRRVVTQL